MIHNLIVQANDVCKQMPRYWKFFSIINCELSDQFGGEFWNVPIYPDWDMRLRTLNEKQIYGKIFDLKSDGF